MVVPHLFKMGGGVSSYLSKTKLVSDGIEFFQGRNVTLKDIMGKVVCCSFNTLIRLRSLQKLMSTLSNY